MATGDVPDIRSRLQALMPNGWFPIGAVPIRDAILTGFTNCFAFVYSYLAYIKLQTRIKTATDYWLDLIAYDFFGSSLVRTPGQSDASFRNQILASLFREKNTRHAVIVAIENLLGTIPTVIEPQRAADTGGYGVASTMGYGVAGVYGSQLMPLECFVQVNVPNALSIAPPNVGGWNSPVWGYGIGSGEWIGKPALDPVLLADIYAALEAIRPVTGVFWVAINIGGTSQFVSTTTIDSTEITVDSSILTIDGGSV